MHQGTFRIDGGPVRSGDEGAGIFAGGAAVEVHKLLAEAHVGGEQHAFHQRGGGVLGLAGDGQDFRELGVNGRIQGCVFAGLDGRLERLVAIAEAEVYGGEEAVDVVVG